MSTPRQVQHRPTREGRKAHELADLKRRQHQLQEEKVRLQVALEKSPRPRKDKKPRAPKQGPQSKDACPVCGSATQLVDLGRMKMVACPECKWHEKRE